MAYDKSQPREKADGVAYVKEAKDGSTYLRIIMNKDAKAGYQFAMFKNNKKTDETSPDYYLRGSEQNGVPKHDREQRPVTRTEATTGVSPKKSSGFPF